MAKEKVIWAVPGLRDNGDGLVQMTSDWQARFGITPHVYQRINWYDRSTSFEAKLQNFVAAILPDAKNQDIILSLLGVSAGTSLVICAAKRLQDLGCPLNGAIINDCGRIAKGSLFDFRNLYIAAFLSPSFFEAVLKAEESLIDLNPHAILSYMARFDQFVPSQKIPNATNLVVNKAGHLRAIKHVINNRADEIAQFIDTLSQKKL